LNHAADPGELPQPRWPLGSVGVPYSFLPEICALFGQPVAGNPMQFMMEPAFAQHGLDWRYLSFEVAPEALADAVRGLRALGFRGANVTAPHQVAVVQHLNRLSETATLMGAVNCITREGQELVGENTDGKGFLQSLYSVTDPLGKHIVLLGAGGAARAIGVELALAGVRKITIVNRTAERGQALADLLTKNPNVQVEFIPWEGKFDLPADAQVVIQATSIGMNDPEAEVPVSFRHVTPGLVAADVVFTPPETAFLSAAKRHNCTILDGLGMLVYQAAIAFQLWTGIAPDTTAMRDAAEEFLSS
jgi:shikimate dehydrogenase